MREEWEYLLDSRHYLFYNHKEREMKNTANIVFICWKCLSEMSVPALQHSYIYLRSLRRHVYQLTSSTAFFFFLGRPMLADFCPYYNLATVSFCRHPSLNFDFPWGIVLLRLEFCWNMHLTVFVWRNRVNNNSSCSKYELFFDFLCLLVSTFRDRVK